MAANNQKNTILLIDSDINQLRELGEIIQQHATIIFATSGEAGLFMAYERRPAMVIVNAQLDDIDGIQVCQRLKQQRETAGIAVIVVSQHYQEKTEITALECGAMDFICAPFNRNVVQARVKTFLGFCQQHHLLQTQAEKDGLTELYNRRYLEEQGRVELKRHYRQQQPLTLALLDIDYFKPYNDAYGHWQGDICLREVAQAINACSRRPGEFVARYGGEEFAAVLPSTDLANAQKYGRWICDQISALAIPHAHSPLMPFITISVGIVSVIPDLQTTFANLITTADSSLYLAKESGRNQFQVASIEHNIIKEVG